MAVALYISPDCKEPFPHWAFHIEQGNVDLGGHKWLKPWTVLCGAILTAICSYYAQEEE